MIVKHVAPTSGKRSSIRADTIQARPLALFTESIVSLLSSPNMHDAFMDLVSLMGQTFPLAAPALYVVVPETPPSAYSVLDPEKSGIQEAQRVLRTRKFSYIRVLVGGQPPDVRERVELTLVHTPRITVILSIGKGSHEDIFREWVNILTPAVIKLVDNEQLRDMAFRDALTGALNHRAFEEMLQAELERASRYKTTFSIMMIDIDWFKKVNDTFGHQVGDLVLRAVVQQLQHGVRKSDYVFRYGGEEFVILMPHTNLIQAKKLAERIRQAVEKMQLMIGSHITISLGISQYKYGITFSDLIERADMGVYLAKTKGRNRVEIVRDAS
ncbi:MAG: GGDEF domain-containing protein [Deltaproteobacteria bacterium]|nr:GGDEF domain-containing protein [Deltaproteobacteria bacterium]